MLIIFRYSVQWLQNIVSHCEHNMKSEKWMEDSNRGNIMGVPSALKE